MLAEDIARGESDQLEFKEVPNRDSSKWLKTVVAFANCRGGRIVFGVTNERKVVGIRGDIFAAKDAIADAVASACTPPIPIQMCVSTVDGRPVIVLEVAAGRQTPYFIKSKGEVAGTYVRFDATTLGGNLGRKGLKKGLKKGLFPVAFCLSLKDPQCRRDRSPKRWECVRRRVPSGCRWQHYWMMGCLKAHVAMVSAISGKNTA